MSWTILLMILGYLAAAALIVFFVRGAAKVSHEAEHSPHAFEASPGEPSDHARPPEWRKKVS